MKLWQLHEVQYKPPTSVNKRLNVAGAYGNSSLTTQALYPEKQPKTKVVRDRDDGDDDDRDLNEEGGWEETNYEHSSEVEAALTGKKWTPEQIHDYATRNGNITKTNINYDIDPNESLVSIVYYYSPPERRRPAATYDQWLTTDPRDTGEELTILSGFLEDGRELDPDKNSALYKDFLQAVEYDIKERSEYDGGDEAYDRWRDEY